MFVLIYIDIQINIPGTFLRQVAHVDIELMILMPISLKCTGITSMCHHA